jgi:predicted ester cyclase
MADTKSVADAAVAAFNAHDEAAMRAMYADNAVLEAPGGVHLEGPDACSAYGMVWLRAFPDATLTVHNQVIAGDSAVHEFTFDGTHTDTLSAPSGDVPATNRHLTGRGTEIIRVADDKVVSHHLYFDQVDVMSQLGLMPEPATA